MMKLYWSPRSRSFSALWLMEETGQPYERVLTDITTGAQKTPEYLAINPMGKVPALRDGDATLAEAAAICAYVAERYPQAQLAPPPGDPKRAKYLYWLFFSPGCIEPAIVQLATKIEMNPVAAFWNCAGTELMSCANPSTRNSALLPLGASTVIVSPTEKPATCRALFSRITPSGRGGHEAYSSRTSFFTPPRPNSGMAHRRSVSHPAVEA